MQTLETLSSKIEELESRIQKLENQNGKQQVIPIKKGQDKKKSLSDHILDLKSTGFFKEMRTAEETFLELSKSYPCEKARVLTELKRISDKKQLRIMGKNIDGKKFKAYVW